MRGGEGEGHWEWVLCAGNKRQLVESAGTVASLSVKVPGLSSFLTFLVFMVELATQHMLNGSCLSMYYLQLIYLFVFGDMVSACSPDCPRTHRVVSELTSSVLELQVFCCHTCFYEMLQITPSILCMLGKHPCWLSHTPSWTIDLLWNLKPWPG